MKKKVSSLLMSLVLLLATIMPVSGTWAELPGRSGEPNTAQNQENEQEKGE